MAKKARKGKRRGRPPGSKSATSAKGTTGALAALKACHADLVAQRSGLDKQITAVSSAMSALGGNSVAAPARKKTTTKAKPKVAKRRGRPKGSMRSGSLKDYITQVVKGSGKVMTIKEITSGVKKAGYKTKSKNLTNAVNNALSGLKTVKKVGRGQYRG